MDLVTTIHEHREINSGIANAIDVINPMGQGVIGRGALRGLRVENRHPSGWYASGFQQINIYVDGRLIASGQLNIPYVSNDHGYYLNLGMFVLGSDYHESPYFAGSGATCECATGINNQRIPFHRSLRITAGWTQSGVSPGFRVDAWYELKGQ